MQKFLTCGCMLSITGLQLLQVRPWKNTLVHGGSKKWILHGTSDIPYIRTMIVTVFTECMLEIYRLRVLYTCELKCAVESLIAQICLTKNLMKLSTNKYSAYAQHPWINSSLFCSMIWALTASVLKDLEHCWWLIPELNLNSSKYHHAWSRINESVFMFLSRAPANSDYDSVNWC